MDLNRARIFVHVVDCGSISAAAIKVKRTQQALTNQLQILEEELEINLMDRQGPKLTLTESGEYLYKVFKEKISEIDASVQEFRAKKDRAEGVIRIGIGEEAFANFIPPLIDSFNDKYPRVSFEFKVATDPQREEMLITNQLDLSFQLFTEDKRILKCTPIYNQTFIPVVSKAFLKKYPMPESIEETLQLPIVDIWPQFGLYHHWIRKNDRTLVPAMQKKSIQASITNIPILKQLVIQGIGIGFLFEDIIQDELKSGELTILPMHKTTHSINAELDLVYKRKSSFGFIHQEFINYVCEQMK